MRFIAIFFLLLNCSVLYAANNLPLSSLKLPPGFSIEVIAEVPNARSMTLGDKGTIFVGSRKPGKVFALIPEKDNLHTYKMVTLISGLNEPNGVAYHNGALYIAEISRIIRLDDIERNINHLPKPVVITTNLPTDQGDHYWRYIGFGPDGKLYISIGMPCNVCLKEDSRFGTIMRMNPDGSHFEVYAKGIRNSVGFTWHPVTKKLWFTDNGRDLLGDFLPPDKLYYAPKPGLDFGFPYYNGKNLPDPEFGKLFPQSRFSLPAYEFPAHVATLGIRFYTGKMFPKKYAQQAFIAEHGSWNRSSKIGYQVVTAKIVRDKVVEVQPFITGWMHDEKVWGRPVDVLNLPDGPLLISDDYAGVVYRVTYKEKK